MAIASYALGGDLNALHDFILATLREDNNFIDFQSGVGNWPSDKVIEQSIIGINFATVLLLRRNPLVACAFLGRMLQCIHVYERSHALRMCRLYVQSACHLLHNFEENIGFFHDDRILDVAFDFMNSFSEDELGWTTDITVLQEFGDSSRTAKAIVTLEKLQSHIICSKYYLAIGALERAQGELLMAQEFYGVVLTSKNFDFRLADLLHRNLFPVPCNIKFHNDDIGAQIHRNIMMHQVELLHFRCIPAKL